MTTPPEPGSKPDDIVDATVESPAAVAHEAAHGNAGEAAHGNTREAARDAAREAAPRPAPRPATPAASTRRTFRRAWMLAIAADAVQWIFMPLFVPGVLSPAEAALDVFVSALLIRWCGWHWAFLPSMVAELVPGMDLVPTWTAAVWIATFGRGSEPPRT